MNGPGRPGTTQNSEYYRLFWNVQFAEKECGPQQDEKLPSFHCNNKEHVRAKILQNIILTDVGTNLFIIFFSMIVVNNSVEFIIPRIIKSHLADTKTDCQKIPKGATVRIKIQKGKGEGKMIMDEGEETGLKEDEYEYTAEMKGLAQYGGEEGKVMSVEYRADYDATWYQIHLSSGDRWCPGDIVYVLNRKESDTNIHGLDVGNIINMLDDDPENSLNVSGKLAKRFDKDGDGKVDDEHVAEFTLAHSSTARIMDANDEEAKTSSGRVTTAMIDDAIMQIDLPPGMIIIDEFT